LTRKKPGGKFSRRNHKRRNNAAKTGAPTTDNNDDDITEDDFAGENADKASPGKKAFEPQMPTKEQVIAFIKSNPGEINKREIAKAFGIKGQDRTQLRILLREISEEGAVRKTAGKSYGGADDLPERGLIEITGTDDDGELIAKPVEWHGAGRPPVIYVVEKLLSESRLERGTQVLARIKKTGNGEYEARILKAMEQGTGKVVGSYKRHKGTGYITPTDKKNKEEYLVPLEYSMDAQDGEIVIAELLPPSSRWSRSKNAARIVKRLGQKDDPRLISLIAIHAQGIPTEFSAASLKEAEALHEPDLSDGRVDMRDIPLVTIDGADARDFDDAVYAEPDKDVPGGWRLIVAIADVSYYVRPHNALDKMAFERGNSTYFADRVVPMLPERLSNDLCSLRPQVNRACLAVYMQIDANARLTSWKFVRGLMKSAARLTYEQVEEAHLGKPDDTTGPLMDRVIKPLYEAYAKLKHAREQRGALELDLPERKAVIDKDGYLANIVPRVRLASHQLVEEFMILANVAAAEALEAKNAPCVYRIHDRPAFDRLEATREFLKEFGYSLPKGDELQPRNINQILKLSAQNEDKQLIHTILLRTQSQAIYSPDNIGHFGLALEKYAHFTSPIRRYADLLVHRSLVRAYNLGPGGMADDEADDLHAIAEHISVTERRSMMAERDVMDRFTAQYLSVNIGKEFKGMVSSVARFGLFVTLDETGADGIVPMSYLPRDYYVHDEKHHALVGQNTGRTFRLTDPVVVRLVEADPLRGSTVFEILDGLAADAPMRRPGERGAFRNGSKSDRNRARDGRRNGGGGGGGRGRDKNDRDRDRKSGGGKKRRR